MKTGTEVQRAGEGEASYNVGEVEVLEGYFQF